MKAMLEFIGSILFISLSSILTWIAYNQVSYLFSLPAKWQHLDFWTVFFLLWLIRAVSAVLRAPNISIPEKSK